MVFCSLSAPIGATTFQNSERAMLGHDVLDGIQDFAHAKVEGDDTQSNLFLYFFYIPT
jgi:hypothetical protein